MNGSILTLATMDELFDRCTNAPPMPMVLDAWSFPVLVRRRYLRIKGLRWYFMGQWVIFAPNCKAESGIPAIPNPGPE